MINQYVITITTVDDGFFSHYDSTIYIDTAFNVNTAEWISKQVDSFVRNLPYTEKLLRVDIKEETDIILKQLDQCMFRASYSCR